MSTHVCLKQSACHIVSLLPRDQVFVSTYSGNLSQMWRCNLQVQVANQLGILGQAAARNHFASSKWHEWKDHALHWQLEGPKQGSKPWKGRQAPWNVQRPVGGKGKSLQAVPWKRLGGSWGYKLSTDRQITSFSCVHNGDWWPGTFVHRNWNHWMRQDSQSWLNPLMNDLAGVGRPVRASIFEAEAAPSGQWVVRVAGWAAHPWVSYQYQTIGRLNN